MSPRRLTVPERRIAELREVMSEHGWYYGRARELLDEIAGGVELAANGVAIAAMKSTKKKPCPHCGGAGRVQDAPCPSCGGAG